LDSASSIVLDCVAPPSLVLATLPRTRTRSPPRLVTMERIASIDHRIRHHSHRERHAACLDPALRESHALTRNTRSSSSNHRVRCPIILGERCHPSRSHEDGLHHRDGEQPHGRSRFDRDAEPSAARVDRRKLAIETSDHVTQTVIHPAAESAGQVLVSIDRARLCAFAPSVDPSVGPERARHYIRWLHHRSVERSIACVVWSSASLGTEGLPSDSMTSMHKPRAHDGDAYAVPTRSMDWHACRLRPNRALSNVAPTGASGLWWTRPTITIDLVSESLLP